MNVTRFFTQFFICYRFQPKLETKISLKAVTQSPSFAYAMNSVLLNNKFENASVVSTIIYRGDYPYISRNFACVSFLIDESKKKQKRNNYFEVTPTDFVINRLPPPFDTWCILSPMEEHFKCKLNCILQHYKPGDKIPTNEIIDRPIDYQRLVSDDLLDDEVLASVDRVNRECSARCERHVCRHAYTKTSVQLRLIDSEYLGFFTRTPTDPDLISNALPMNQFVEFFSFLCGCFGTWFGVSFLSLDPFKDKKKKKLTGSSFRPFVINIVNPSVRVARILSR